MIQSELDKLTAAGAGAFVVSNPVTKVFPISPANSAIGYGRRVEADKTVTLQAFCFDGSVIETK